ncbi:decaprenyl-phosphate phosphoribosyltransferase [Pelosinus propionicus]|uniref:4-hydroxybenzoate polyprenyltransferase n=1 Tax=Pelosinus propionicus DSM 13327 TaxID=1123291 RepID=A0A1I4N6C3_9FIRM|nr:decaprenyl-phosphate phosphoribosyltransferase [Pelosinus propionicus]SFM11049.1 4-hydroxybenzoate polyprenyltransferase [Pelosinus propionicus DSM 13327]
MIKKDVDKILPYLMVLRPKQWTKNLLVFAALIFSIKTVSVDMLVQSAVAFILFCTTSGCVYIINDYLDREADSRHPEKCHRPIASGKLHPLGALLFGSVLLGCSLTAAFIAEPLLSLLLLGYFMVNVAYSMKLKRIVIIDIMVIAFGFVLRAIGGGLAINVSFTPWFLICTMLLALFLAISKRRHELYLLSHHKGEHRKVLEQYSPELLDQLNSIVTTAAIMSYSLFTFTSGHTIHLMWTIPLVMYGIFRYLYLIHIEGQGGRPEKVLVEDSHILGTVILFAAMVVSILYYFE